MWMQMIIRSGPLRNHKQLLRDGRNDDGPTGLIPTQDSDSHQAVYQLVLVIKPVWPQHYFPLKRYMYFILKNPIPSGKFFPLAGLTCQFQGLVSARNDGSKCDGPDWDCAPWIFSQVLYERSNIWHRHETSLTITLYSYYSLSQDIDAAHLDDF